MINSQIFSVTRILASELKNKLLNKCDYKHSPKKAETAIRNCNNEEILKTKNRNKLKIKN